MLPTVPRVARAGQQSVHRCPTSSAVSADLHIDDLVLTGPCRARQRVPRRCDKLPWRGVSDDGLDLHPRVIGVVVVGIGPVHGHVPFHLVKALELMVQHMDSHQPLDGGHAIPTGHEKPQRMTVNGRKRLTVHLVGQESIWVQGLVEGQAALVGDVRGIADSLVGSMVSPFEQHLRSRIAYARHLQYVTYRYACPLGVAHDAVAFDLLHHGAGACGGSPMLRHRAVATALEGHLKPPLWQIPQVIHRQAQVAPDLPIDGQTVGGGIQLRVVTPVVAHVEKVGGSDRLLQGGRRGGPCASTCVGGYQLRRRQCSGVLKGHVSLRIRGERLFQEVGLKLRCRVGHHQTYRYP